MNTTLQCAYASLVTYSISADSDITKCDVYPMVGYIEPPKAVQLTPIDACTIGRTADHILVAFRGTLPLSLGNVEMFINSLCDWAGDDTVVLIPSKFTPGYVHAGFCAEMELLYAPVVEAIVALQAKYSLPIIFTGHSKGGALATLAAQKYGKVQQVITFASPRCGDSTFAATYNSMILHTRWENTDDIVPHLPVGIEGLGYKVIDSRLYIPRLLSFAPVGVLQFIDWGGKIEPQVLGLNERRDTSMWCLIATLRLAQIANDHDLQSQYLFKLQSLWPLTP